MHVAQPADQLMIRTAIEDGGGRDDIETIIAGITQTAVPLPTRCSLAERIAAESDRRPGPRSGHHYKDSLTDLARFAVERRY